MKGVRFSGKNKDTAILVYGYDILNLITARLSRTAFSHLRMHLRTVDSVVRVVMYPRFKGVSFGHYPASPGRYFMHWDVV